MAEDQDPRSGQNSDVLSQNFISQNDDEDFVEDFEDAWHAELDDALIEGFVDHTVIRNICKCRVLPCTQRAEVWKICLNVASRGDALKCWDRKLDLPGQSKIHWACEALCADSMDLKNPEQMASDIESVFTFYCKSRAAVFEPSSAWTDIIRPLISLQELDRADLYNCFYAMIHHFIPRDEYPEAPYNLFRLLLLYHDPELCSFLDSHKVAIRSFMKPWFRSLFASCCKLDVTLALWDIYLQRADPFFMFFLALVILVNAREQIISTMTGKTEVEIVKALTDYPRALEPVDVEDFCQLAVYFADKTPLSVRKIYQEALFGGPVILSLPNGCRTIEEELAQSLCLQVAASDILLLQSNTTEDDNSEEGLVHFFLVDCRTPDLYNAGHLNTAFHFDATLMLREPNEFLTAIEALFKAQEQAIHTGSAAGGEHLCLIGSGVEEEDQYVHMVISHLLKNHHSKVGIVRGGFKAILKYLSDVNLDVTDWIAGSCDVEHLLQCAITETSSSLLPQKKRLEAVPKTSDTNTMESLMKTFTSTLKTKSQSLKEKVTKLIENPGPETFSHVDAFHQSKAYRGTQPVFSIGDEDEESMDEKQVAMPQMHKVRRHSDFDEKQLIDLRTWLKERAVEQVYECFIVSPDVGHLDACLVVVGDDLYCLRAYRQYGKSKIVSIRPLSAVTKITSKRSCPELITFRFKFPEDRTGDGETASEAIDRYFLGSDSVSRRLRLDVSDSQQVT